MKQVAELGGVSLATVSRVLGKRDAGLFAESTRRRVLDAARQLGWVHNRLVQGIQTGRTGTVGVLALPLPGHWQAMLGAAHAALLERDTVPMALYPSYSASGTSELAQLRQMIECRVDAIACWPLVDAQAESYLLEVCAARVPVVTVDYEPAGGDGRCGALRNSEPAGMALALEHLWSLGHRTIGYVGPASTESWASLRCAEFTRWMLRKRRRPAFTLAVRKDQHGALDELAQQMPLASAVVVANEQLAAATWHVAREVGLRVPRDVSVVSFGQPHADYPVWPRFTIVDQRPQELGRRLAEMLLPPLQGGDEQRDIVEIQASLAIGETTGLARE